MSKPLFVLVVTGGRNFADRDRVYGALDELLAKHRIALLIHGAATGADSLANDWAEQNRIACLPVPAWWAKHGNAAGPIRNAQMAALADMLALHIDECEAVLLAFPGGRGTANMRSVAGNYEWRIIEG
jgi:hypothetical protein